MNKSNHTPLYHSFCIYQITLTNKSIHKAIIGIWSVTDNSQEVFRGFGQGMLIFFRVKNDSNLQRLKLQ